MLRDRVVTFVYGRERILQAPHRVMVDSRGRILMVDPDIRAVHVLGGGNSFRIEGGPRRRLRMPNGSAVDAADNIYIADSERGLVLVYAPDGTFLRYIGKCGDESLFYSPTAIAIDRNSGILFLLDTPRHVLFVLDLAGNILKRIGASPSWIRQSHGRKHSAGPRPSHRDRDPEQRTCGDGLSEFADPSHGSAVQADGAIQHSRCPRPGHRKRDGTRRWT